MISTVIRSLGNKGNLRRLRSCPEDRKQNRDPQCSKVKEEKLSQSLSGRRFSH